MKKNNRSKKTILATLAEGWSGRVDECDDENDLKKNIYNRYSSRYT